VSFCHLLGYSTCECPPNLFDEGYLVHGRLFVVLKT